MTEIAMSVDGRIRPAPHSRFLESLAHSRDVQNTKSSSHCSYYLKAPNVNAMIPPMLSGRYPEIARP